MQTYHSFLDNNERHRKSCSSCRTQINWWLTSPVILNGFFFLNNYISTPRACKLINLPVFYRITTVNNNDVYNVDIAIMVCFESGRDCEFYNILQDSILPKPTCLYEPIFSNSGNFFYYDYRPVNENS